MPTEESDAVIKESLIRSNEPTITHTIAKEPPFRPFVDEPLVKIDTKTTCLQFIALLLLLSLPPALISISINQRPAAIEKAGMDYLRESIRPKEFREVQFSNFWDYTFDSNLRIPVSTAEKENGIRDKQITILRFIYRESPTVEWKDAEYRLWLEQRTDWKVVKEEKVK